MAAAPTALPRALAGVRVIDCADGIAGAFCTKLLADFGAEVITVEPPGTGHPLRALGPFPGDVPDPERAGLFLHLHTGKRSLTLDLDTTSGQIILRKLLAKTDVLVDSARPATLAARGLDYASLKDDFPALICASVTAFGHTGPWADYVGDAFTAWAAGGLAYVTGDPDNEPLNNGTPVAEYMAGFNLLIGILAALAHRDAGHGGQALETSLLEAIAANEEYGALMYSYQGAIRRRWHSRHPFRYPSDIMACQDGHVAVLNGRMGLQEIAVLVERPDLIDDPLFVSPRARFPRWQEFEALLAPYLLAHPAAAIVAAAQELHQPFALVPTAADLLSDPHLLARDALVPLEATAPDTSDRANALRQPGPPWRMSATPWQTGPAPTLGADNRALLTSDEVGYTPAETVILRERGVI